MKQLFVNGNATTLFISSHETVESIKNWVMEMVIIDDTNMFNLNEQHSCSVEMDGNDIFIGGDEDSKLITIEEITPIKLN